MRSRISLQASYTIIFASNYAIKERKTRKRQGKKQAVLAICWQDIDAVTSFSSETSWIGKVESSRKEEISSPTCIVFTAPVLGMLIFNERFGILAVVLPSHQPNRSKVKTPLQGNSEVNKWWPSAVIQAVANTSSERPTLLSFPLPPALLAQSEANRACKIFQILIDRMPTAASTCGCGWLLTQL